MEYSDSERMGTIGTSSEILEGIIHYIWAVVLHKQY